MKVLLVTPYYFPQNHGGAPIVYKTLLDKSEHNIAIYTDAPQTCHEACHLYDKSSTHAIYRAKNMIFRLKCPENKFMGSARLVSHFTRHIVGLINTIIQYKPEIIVCGNVVDSGWLVYFSSLFFSSCTVMSYVHGEEITMKTRSGFWARILEYGKKKVLMTSKHIITVSDFSKSCLLNIGVPIEKISVITNGVDLDNYCPVDDTLKFHNSYNILGKPVISTLSRLVPKKGIDNVIRALPRIIKTVPDVIYLVGGTGPDKNRLIDLSIELDVSDHVKFCGYIDDNNLNGFINTSDVFVMPNRSIDGDTEGFGLVFLEANACGIPVIGGIDGGTANAIIDGVTGFRIDGNDTDAIADKIILLLTHPDIRKKMGIAGREWVLESQGWDKKIRQFDNIIEAMA